MNLLEPSEIDELADVTASQGSGRLLVAGDPEIQQLAGVPTAWRQALSNRDDAPARVVEMWKTVGHLLPRTLDELEVRLLDVLVACSGPQACSLVYAFREGG